MTSRQLTATIVAQLGTALASLVGIASWDDAPKGVQPGLIVVVLILTLTAGTIDVAAFKSTQPRGYRSPARINRFMHDWISQRGKVAVFSNDMSWVSDEIHASLVGRIGRRLRGGSQATIKGLLIEKARQGELILCLPRTTALSTELQGEGAIVSTYANLGLVPESRFTIVRYGQQDAEVAIGRRVGGVHRIETFANGAHPAFAMAEDLVRFVTASDGRT